MPNVENNNNNNNNNSNNNNNNNNNNDTIKKNLSEKRKIEKKKTLQDGQVLEFIYNGLTVERRNKLISYVPFGHSPSLHSYVS